MIDTFIRGSDSLPVPLVQRDTIRTIIGWKERFQKFFFSEAILCEVLQKTLHTLAYSKLGSFKKSVMTPKNIDSLRKGVNERIRLIVSLKSYF